MMIVTRTPLRISLVGGGTDMPAFYMRSFGAVVSLAIDKYIYVGINRKFDGQVRASYSKTENVHHPMELKHDIIRESLLHFDAKDVEVVTVADIPGTGTGLGSSSALAVGLVKALTKFTFREFETADVPDSYAETAWHVERNMCLHHVGKQDHYASSFGGLNYFQFNTNSTVDIDRFEFSAEELAEFESHMTLLWTGRSRSATDILKQQESNMSGDRMLFAQGMRDLAVQMKNDLARKDFSNIGVYLNTNWNFKRQLAQGITNEWIDQKYEQAIAAGAQGGKILGAGGGGFFLFWGKPGLGPELEKATKLKAIPFKTDIEGCKVVY